MFEEKYKEYLAEEKKENPFFIFITIIILYTCVSFFIYNYLQQPVVKWSYTQNKCVDCIGCSCDDLPPKYIKELVK